MNSSEQLILRGLHLLIRASFSPNEPETQARHFIGLQQDIGPWLKDYATEIEKPVVDFTITPLPEEPAGRGGLQS